MKKKVAILGSTGSIGLTLLQLLEKDKSNFEIVLLTANKSHQQLFKQAKKLNVKNLIITNQKSYESLIKKSKNLKINVYNNYDNFIKNFKGKIDYTMSAISGISGLKPTLQMIKFSKKIAIANKETIICGWNLIDKELKKNNTDFIPVDSEHFSIWYGLGNSSSNDLEKVFLTASGGPFLKKSIKHFKNIKKDEALNHPNWKMGKKISTDSATLINKVYEVIEAKKIFNIAYNKVDILIHPKSYVHAILKFKNGMSKIIIHETTMKIPIFNTLYLNKKIQLKSKKINIEILNDLDFQKVKPKIFPMVKILDLLPEKNSLFETVIVSANDKLVELFLENKIKFIDIQKNLFKVIKRNEFSIYKQKIPKNVNEILNLNNYVRLKISNLVYKTSSYE
jgi:1-deoxy-D-xylulose-5-phosphate reductoisomerase